MYSGEAVYLRTESGREEIRNKSHGLTQSERLVLILIDGVTSIGGLKVKLKGLTEERFDRALTTLIDRQFVTEILLRFDGAIPEEVAEDIAERFLNQDDLDPVTIISYDPEEEFGTDAPLLPDTAPAPKIDLKQWVNREDALQEDIVTLRSSDPAPSSKTDAARREKQPDLLLEDTSYLPSLSSRMKEGGTPNPILFSASRHDKHAARNSSSRSVLLLTSSHWRQLLIAIGLGFLLLLYLRFR